MKMLDEVYDNLSAEEKEKADEVYSVISAIMDTLNSLDPSFGVALDAVISVLGNALRKIDGEEEKREALATTIVALSKIALAPEPNEAVH